MLTSGWSSARSRKLLLGAAIVLVLMLTVPHFMATNSGIYKLAVSTAHQSPQFREALGPPISEAWFSEGEWQWGDSGKGKMLIPVRGRLGSGNLRALAIRDAGHWRLTQLTLELAQPNEHIDLLSKTPM